MEKTMKLHSQYGGEYDVSLEINTYLNNGCNKPSEYIVLQMGQINVCRADISEVFER